jgi:hypothetical protein
MDHSFAVTCSVCNGMPPASKSGPNFEAMPERRADVSPANVDLKPHDSPMCPEGTQVACGEPKAAGMAEIRKSGKLDPNFWNFFP